MRAKYLWAVPVVLVLAWSAVQVFRGPSPVPGDFPPPDPEEVGSDAESELATFGSGCFWCTEAVFQQIKGVRSAVPGYSGGAVENPTYEQVCDGTTGHAEVVQVTFDPRVVSYPELLEVFWRSHDPTTRDRQGNDVGPQYRSVVFFHTDRQRRLAERYRAKIDEAHVFPSPLVTEIAPFTAFYPAEAHHRDFYATNPRQSYCRVVIRPKIDKLRKVFQDRVKDPGER